MIARRVRHGRSALLIAAMRSSRVLVFLAVTAAATGCTDTTDPVVATPTTMEAMTPTIIAGTVDAAVSSTPTVRVKDQQGTPMSGVLVTFALSAGGGVLENSSTRTGVDGSAAIGSWKLGTSAGNHSLTARSSGLADVVFSGTAVAGPVAQIIRAGGSNQRAPASSAVPLPLKARVTDSFHNPVQGAPVTFSVASGGGTLAGAQAVSDAYGLASSGVWTLGSATGLQQVKAKAFGHETVFAAEACPGASCVPLANELAFVSEQDGNSEIYSTTVGGTERVRLTNHPARDIDPAWSPDGRQIAFASDRAGRLDIYVMNGDGSNVVRRTTVGEYNSSPAWSPDGRSIAFSSLRNGQYGIYVMNLNGDWANPAHVGYDRGWNNHPAWSPDGRKIAFISDWHAFDFVYDLYVMNADGSAIMPLLLGPFATADHDFYYQPAWSPDGQKLAVVVCAYAWDNCYPYSSIAIVNADGSSRAIIAQAGGFARPTWSPDGSMIAFSVQDCRDCEGSIRYVSTDGSRSGVIASSGHSPAWRP